MSDIDTDRTDEAVCPHCGHEHSDSHEWFSGSDGDGSTADVECCVCGQPFTLRLHVDISYTTRKPKEAKP